MAKVIISAYSNVSWTKQKYHDSYIEGIGMALERCGNEVLMIRNNEFVETQLLHEVRRTIDFESLISDMISFQPDLILSFNNSLPHPDLVERSECPILVYPSDAPCYYTFKTTIEAHQERYYFLHTAIQVTEALKIEFPFIQDDHIIEFGYGTELRAKEMPQDLDLSFVGSIGNYSAGLPTYFYEPLSHEKQPTSERRYQGENRLKNHFYACLENFKQNSMNGFTYPFPEPEQISESVEATMVHILTCKNRFEVLSSMTDLNLKIYGFPGSWARTITYNHKLFRCFDYELIVSMEHITRTYNRSKIALNLPHGFTIDGFSWRVCDILASNAVLLSPYKKDLDAIVSPYVELPMYSSNAEAREIALKLLADDMWRREISEGCQLAIEETCRFDQKFERINHSFPDFLLISSDIGKISHIDHSKYLLEEESA